MSRNPGTPDPMESLLGAYALDAVDADERAQVEAYLDANPAAQAEVDELRETAGWLAQTASEPPAELWDRIAAKLPAPPAGVPVAPALPIRAQAAEQVPSPVASLDAARARRRVPRWVTAVAGVAAALLIVLMGAQIISQGNKVDNLQRSISSPDSVRRAAEAAKLAPGARQVALKSTDGNVAASVVVLPSGTGYLEENNLPTLKAGETYQLWAVMDGSDSSAVVSAGVLGPKANVTPFHVDGKVVAFAVTQEKAPGVLRSNNKPVVSGNVSA